jgi:hypothetical protein
MAPVAATRPGWRALVPVDTRWRWRPHSRNLQPLDGRVSSLGDGRFRLTATFDADFVPIDLALVFEQGTVDAVTLNDEPVDLTRAAPVLPEQVEFADEAARTAPLWGTGAARIGRNVVEALYRVPPSERIAFFDGPRLGSLFLTGSFALEARPAGDLLIPPPATLEAGDWSVAGYPRYAGTATYRQTVVLPELPPGSAAHLFVDAFDGSVALEIDDEPVGDTLTSPCAFDLAGVLRPGATTLAIAVTNCLAARIAGGHPSGLAAVRLEYRAP